MIVGLEVCPINDLKRTDMAKATTIKIKLVSTADTGYYYVTKKNSRTQTRKIPAPRRKNSLSANTTLLCANTWNSRNQKSSNLVSV